MSRMSDYLQEINETILEEAAHDRVAGGAPKRWRGERIVGSWPIKALKAVACLAVMTAVIGAAVILPTLKRPPQQPGDDVGEDTVIYELAVNDVIEELGRHEAVTSITPFTVDGFWSEYPAYQINFFSDGLSMNAKLVLPKTVTNDLPIVFYFPESGHGVDDLPAKFAAQGLAVVMLDIRGYSNNQGKQDLGGKDFADVLTLYDVIRSSEAFCRAKAIVMGASYGSIRAFRLAAEKGDEISACFVDNAITDVSPSAEIDDISHRDQFGTVIIGSTNEGIRRHYEFFIGLTYEEAPQEYAMRSAVTFVDRLVSPVYLVINTDSYYQKQNRVFATAMTEAGRECHVLAYDDVALNFTIDVMRDLIPHMRRELGLEAEEAVFPADAQKEVEFSLEEPSGELLERFDAETDAYKKRQPRYDPDYDYPYYIDRYYGRFGDVVFLLMSGGGEGYACVLTSETVAGYEFHYSDSNTIRVWAHGSFVRMKLAYEQGIISKEQVAVIAQVKPINCGHHYGQSDTPAEK